MVFRFHVSNHDQSEIELLTTCLVRLPVLAQCSEHEGEQFSKSFSEPTVNLIFLKLNIQMLSAASDFDVQDTPQTGHFSQLCN